MGKSVGEEWRRRKKKIEKEIEKKEFNIILIGSKID